MQETQLEPDSPELQQTPFNGMDTQGLAFSLIEATMEAFQTNTLTPIIKEELKLKIQTSRLAAGKEELPKPVFKEPEKYELSPEEAEKKRIRKEKNRIAASKCRNKKKMEKEKKESLVDEILRTNKELKTKVEDLTREKEHMIYKLNMANIPIPKSIHEQKSSTQTETVPSYTYTPMSTSCSSYEDMPSSSGFSCHNQDSFSYAEEYRQPEFCDSYTGHPGHDTDFLAYDEHELKHCAAEWQYFLPVSKVEEEAKVPGEDDFIPDASSPTLYMSF